MQTVEIRERSLMAILSLAPFALRRFGTRSRGLSGPTPPLSNFCSVHPHGNQSQASVTCRFETDWLLRPLVPKEPPTNLFWLSARNIQLLPCWLSVRNSFTSSSSSDPPQRILLNRNLVLARAGASYSSFLLRTLGACCGSDFSSGFDQQLRPTARQLVSKSGASPSLASSFARILARWFPP